MGVIHGPLPPTVIAGAAVWYDFMNPECYTDGATSATNLGTLSVTATIPAAWTNASGHMAPSVADATFVGTNIDTDNSTYEFWLWPTNLQDGLYQGATWGNPGPGIQLHWVDMSVPGSPMDMYIRGSSYAAYHAQYCLVQNAWNHIVMTFVGTTVTLYVGGSLFGSGTIDTIIDNSSTILGPPYHLDGNYLDIMRIYHSVLTPAEILNNFNAEKSRFGV